MRGSRYCAHRRFFPHRWQVAAKDAALAAKKAEILAQVEASRAAKTAQEEAAAAAAAAKTTTTPAAAVSKEEVSVQVEEAKQLIPNDEEVSPDGGVEEAAHTPCPEVEKAAAEDPVAAAPGMEEEES